jgi:hypothetical protein
MRQLGPYLPRYDDLTLDHLTIDGAPSVLDLDGAATTSTGTTFDPIGPVQIGNSTFRHIADPRNRVTHVTVGWSNSTINDQPAR